ncbi:hypothetical protein Tco_1312468 [Tanacetum coccineum]
MAAVEVPQTLKYKGGQLNVAPVLEVENLTNWKKRSFCKRLLVKSFSSLNQSPFQPKPLSSSQHKPELRPTKDFGAKYNKVKAKPALLISSASASKAATVKNKADDTKVSIPGVERPWLSEAEGFILPNHDTGRILPIESQRNTTDPLVVVIDSSATDYESADESSVCSTPLPPLNKVDGVKPVSRPKTIKSILRLKSTFKAESLKCVIINESTSALTKGNKISSSLKVNSTHAGKLKSVKIEVDPPLAIHLKSLGRSSSRSKRPRPSKHFFPPCIHCVFIDHLSDDYLNYPIYDICGSYDHDTHGHNMIIYLRRRIKPNNPQHVMKCYETCGSTIHTTTDHNNIEWFRRGEELQAKKAEALKSTKAESSNANRSKTPTRRVTCTNTWNNQDLRWCLEMTLHAQLKVMALSNFDDKRETIFNSNKEVVMIAPRVRDVYVLDMTSSAQESCLFAKASDNLNWAFGKKIAI